MRTAFAVLYSCVLLALGLSMNPAAAGGYYSNGYYGNGYYRNGYNGNGYYGNGYYGGHSSVWYSSKCCYRKIVRHVRVVNYVPTEPYRRYGYYGNGYGNGYYDRPYRYGYNGYYSRPYINGYYGRPYRGGYYGRPYGYRNNYYVGPRRGYVSASPRDDDGYDAYNSVYSAKTKTCEKQRTRIPDGRGGWVWGMKTVCR
jgi:hypothetical protein